MTRWLIAAAGLLALPGTAGAQALSCRIPRAFAMPRPDLPGADQPVRRLPIGSYTLAVSWSPEYCRGKRGDDAARFQCGSGNRFGFVLHGLWPDGEGKEWPQYCQATPIVPREVIRSTLCSTPSPQLVQHEWAKHGTCIPGASPKDYFARSTGMFRRLNFPDMRRLSYTRLTVAEFARAFARANPGLPADAVRVAPKRGGWLDELWLCVDTRFRYAGCDAAQGGGAPAGAALKIWRGGRDRAGDDRRDQAY